MCVCADRLPETAVLAGDGVVAIAGQSLQDIPFKQAAVLLRLVSTVQIHGRKYKSCYCHIIYLLGYIC